MKNNITLFLLSILFNNLSLQATNNYQTRIANFQKQEQLRFCMQDLYNKHNAKSIDTVKKEMKARKKIIEEFQAQGINLHIPATTITITTEIPDIQNSLKSHINIPALRTIITHTNPDSAINS